MRNERGIFGSLGIIMAGGDKMVFFGKKELAIIDIFKEHLAAIDDTLSALEKLMVALKEKDNTAIETYDIEVHRLESLADTKRRNMENAMYSGAFLPNFRGDFLGLAENFDKVANKAEAVADQIVLQKMEIPDDLMEDLINQLSLSIETYRASRNAAESLFDDMDSVNEAISKTEHLENLEDSHERALIKKVFGMDKSLAEKRQYRELIITIGNIADRAEDCSDRLEIIVLKRQV